MTGFGFRKPATAQRGLRPAWAPPSPPYARSDRGQKCLALCIPAVESKLRQMQMLNPNVGMAEEVGFIVSERHELLRHGSAERQALDATGGPSAHTPQHDRKSDPAQDAR